jgi:small GTP-binding protein
MAQQSGDNEIPRGLKLRHTLKGRRGTIYRFSWSPDGRMIASPSEEGFITVWDAETSFPRYTIMGHSGGAISAAWSPDGKMFASNGWADTTVRVWDSADGKLLKEFKMDSASGANLEWSPNGDLLAASSHDYIWLWDIGSEALKRKIRPTSAFGSYVNSFSPDGRFLGSGGYGSVEFYGLNTRSVFKFLDEGMRTVWDVKWSPRDDQIFASASQDGAIRVWKLDGNQPTSVLEGHMGAILSLSFSTDGLLLASKSDDGFVGLWRLDTGERIAAINEPSAKIPHISIAFHPTKPVLATLGEEDTVIRIWDLDLKVLLGVAPTITSVRYSNAKVVLVGDTGVGKSGLGIVLTGEPWVETGSTHGRRVWTFDSREVESEDGRKETHEILLWDLAGQPDYRLIHQLHLTDVAVALVVFDSRSQTDPFAGVRHWDKALRQAQRVQGNAEWPVKKFLVAARADVGRVGVSAARTEALKEELGFDGYFETSAKEGWSVAELAETIRGAIKWDALPIVSSTELFQTIKAFLVAEKEEGRLLSTADDLYRAFLKSEDAPEETAELRAQFETCVGRVESRGLIQRLSFGDLVLLQPELRDAYASAMVNAAKDEPDGLGCINEKDARDARFRIPESERVKSKEQERLLLIATVEELLRHEIASREHGDDGLYLVFPSQLTRENPDLPDPEGKSVVFTFEGPVLSVYATLAVRLSHSGLFAKKEMWKNAAVYAARAGGVCGIFLREVAEGRGELTLFFDQGASEETRFQFEEYIHEHLRRRALPETVHRRRVFVCQECATPVSDVAAKRRRERGFDWIACNVCDERISLMDREERLTTVPRSAILEMDINADARREREAAVSVLEGKRATKDFDVFLCHNEADKAEVKKIGEQLKERGILPWLDEWELPPGQPWQRLLEEQIPRIKSAAVFVGAEGIGPWQRQELDAFLREFARRECPVIPVVLPTATKQPKLPLFLEGVTWVDFRRPDPDPMERLVWGITKERGKLREPFGFTRPKS